MKGIIKLKNPIDINGKKVPELSYDTDAITSQHFAEADARKMKASGSKGGNLSGAVELDYSFHLYLGFASVVAINPEIDFNDLERLRGRDVMEFMKVGRNFIIKSEDEESPEDDSSEPSETSPDATTHQSQTSSEDL